MTMLAVYDTPRQARNICVEVINSTFTFVFLMTKPGFTLISSSESREIGKNPLPLSLSSLSTP